METGTVESISKRSGLSSDCLQAGGTWALQSYLLNFPEKLRSPDLCMNFLISTTNQKSFTYFPGKTKPTRRPALAPGISFTLVNACHVPGE